MTPRIALLVVVLTATLVPVCPVCPVCLGGPGGAETGRTAAASSADPAGRWAWPTPGRVVIRPWEPPPHDYGAGHRGIDVVGAVGTPARAVDDGTVAFAGTVAGRGVVTVDHGDGLVSTLDSVTPSVSAGDVVARDSVVGTVAAGHCPAADPCLHLGARVDGAYVDPLPYLSAAAWPVLLPGP